VSILGFRMNNLSERRKVNWREVKEEVEVTMKEMIEKWSRQTKRDTVVFDEWKKSVLNDVSERMKRMKNKEEEHDKRVFHALPGTQFLQGDPCTVRRPFHASQSPGSLKR
jgi:hypothetical protein